MAHQDDGEKSSTHMVTSAAAGFCYPPAAEAAHISSGDQTPLVAHLQRFEPNHGLYGLGSGMDVIAFQPKSLIHHRQISEPHQPPGLWKGFLINETDSQAGPSSLKGPVEEINDVPTEGGLHDQHNQFTDEASCGESRALILVAPEPSLAGVAAWQQNNRLLIVDHDHESSLMPCVFPFEANERPSQGLSLSLSSTNPPSNIGLHTFDPRQNDHLHHPREGLFLGKPSNFHQQVIMQQDDSYLGNGETTSTCLQQQGMHRLIRSSKYLGPTKELMNEFCNLGAKETDRHLPPKLKNKQLDQDDANLNHNASTGTSTSSRQLQSLYPVDPLELPKRLRKLLAMLEELDRRYKHYCEQMKAVVSSFEAVAGNGAATVYTTLASKAMSRHFRSLRDGIVGQIKAAQTAMVDKDSTAVAPGMTKGETPRLRILDQMLRQQRAFQQMGVMESHPWRPQRGLPERAVSVLRAWLFEHFLHPYPSDVDKHVLSRQSGLSRSQVSNWFINARVRLWKPMVEEMYMEEAKEEQMDKMGSSTDAARGSIKQDPQADREPSSSDHLLMMIRPETDCLSSMITSNSEKNRNKNDGLGVSTSSLFQHQHQQHVFGGAESSFGPIDHHDDHLDFSVPYSQNAYYKGSGGGNGRVSLALGLQQNAAAGSMRLAFSSSATAQNHLLYARDPMEDSLLDVEQGVQNLPYRNLMGAQLLHDYT